MAKTSEDVYQNEGELRLTVIRLPSFQAIQQFRKSGPDLSFSRLEIWLSAYLLCQCAAHPKV
jgi:hypothetical protein